MPGTLMPNPDPPRTELLLRLPELRARLEEQRQFRIEQIDSLSVGEGPGTPSLAGGVTGSPVDSVHSQVTAALLAGARQALADIDTALYRIHNGQYGDCLECGQPIGMPRLRTLPQTTLCADCHRARTTGTDRSARPDPARNGAPDPARNGAKGAGGPAGRDATPTR